MLSNAWANEAQATSSGSKRHHLDQHADPPTPPWQSGSSAPQQAALVTTALAQQPIINASAISLDSNTPDNDDYRNLFAIYQGLNALDGLATDASATNLTAIQKQQYASAFTAGLFQVMSFVGSTKFNNLTLATGETATSQTSTAGVPTAANSDQYVGRACTSATRRNDPRLRGRCAVRADRQDAERPDHDGELRPVGDGLHRRGRWPMSSAI